MKQIKQNIKNEVTAIGASMIDIYGRSEKTLLIKDSNPGNIVVNCGGVTRNISENLALCNINVKLITTLAKDAFSEMIIRRCKQVGIDISASYYQDDYTTTTYMAILDDQGDMHVAVSDTKALDNMPLSHIIKHQSLIKRSDIIVIDAALPDTIIDHILNIAQNSRIYVDPVSTNKAKSIKGKLSKFDTLKCNILEASYLSDIAIVDKLTLETAGLKLIQQGLKNVFITLGKDGVYYQNKENQGYLPSYAHTIKNATGAGDAFMAGIIYGAINDLSIHESALFASGMSALSLDSITAVNPMITVNKVMEIIRKGEKYEFE